MSLRYDDFDPATELVSVRRQWDDTHKIAKVRVADVRNVKWDIISGGVNERSPQPYLYGYIWCTQLLEGDVAHSCQHGPPPHSIKICIVGKDNPKRVFDYFLSKVGPKPTKGRKRLSKEEKARRVYVLWESVKQRTDFEDGQQVAIEDIFTAPLIQSLIKRCNEREVKWALVSQTFGVMPGDRPVKWSTDTAATKKAEQELSQELVAVLEQYPEIWVYISETDQRLGRARVLLEHTQLQDRVRLINNIKEIR